MTTIFDTSFVENLRRVRSSARPDSTAAEGSSKTFSDVLNQAKNQTESNKLADASSKSEATQGGPKTPPAQLNNLTLKEQVEAKANQPPIKIIPSSPYASKPIERQNIVNVRHTTDNRAIQTDKIPTTKVSVEPTLPEIVKNQAPGQPELFSAIRERLYPSRSAEYSRSTLEDIIVASGKFHGVDPSLSIAVAQAESSFRTDVISKDGHQSKGLFQLLDTTGREMMSRLGVVEDDYDPFDPALNAHLGVGYLRRLHDLFSEPRHLAKDLQTHPASSAADLEKLAVAAFNSGEGNVARAQARALSNGLDAGAFSNVENHLAPQIGRYVAKVLSTRNAQS